MHAYEMVWKDGTATVVFTRSIVQAYDEAENHADIVSIQRLKPYDDTVSPWEWAQMEGAHV